MVSRKEISTVAPVLFLAVICLVSGQTCTIGRNDDNELSQRSDRRFYLDVNNPANCTGTITNWRVCYYGRSDSGRINSYWATYAVYRRMGSGEDESYVKVSELFRAVRTTTLIGFLDSTDGLNEIGFNCYTDSIDAGDSLLTIRPGDIIGACVFDPEDGDVITRRELNIVGEVSAGQGELESLMRSDIDVDCTMDDIPSSIRLTDLRGQNNRRLHIYANVEPAPELVPPTAPITTTDIQGVTQADNQEAHQESSSRGFLIATIAGSTSGVLIVLLCIIILMVVLSVVLYLKCRQKAINLTSNVAYTGQCKNEDIDYYSISQPSLENDIENRSTEDQPLTAILYDTISESQPTISHVPETNEEVVHTIIEHHTENGCSHDQPSSLLYDTIEETQITEVLQSGSTGGSSPTMLSAKEASHKESDVSTMIENVAYGSTYSSPVDLEAQQLCEGVSLEQNVAYKPISTTVQLSPNVAYRSNNLVAWQPHEEGVSLEQNIAYEQTTALLSPNVAYGCHDLEAQQNVAYESAKVVLSPNVAYEAHNNLEAQQPYKEVSHEHNVAYEQTKVVLSPNVAYASHDHVHQGTESQDECEYIISNGTVAEDANDS